jgi:hypothetical protein
MNLECGTQVIGVWGAMVPESHGYVSSMEDTNQGTEVDIMWDNGCVYHVMLNQIQDDYLENNQVGFFIDPFAEELM